MNKLILLPLVLALASCAAPKPLTVSGSDRKPVNDLSAVNAVEAYTIGAELAATRQRLVEMQAEINGLKAVKTQPDARMLQSLHSRLDAAERIVQNGANTIFRLSYDFGSTTLTAPPVVARVLVTAASKADKIELRGRTDAKSDNPTDARIALARAVAARDFLVSNGIESSKIQVSSMASGGFFAENKTPAGRALNRRVEVELSNVETAAVKDQLVTVTR